MLVMFSRLAVLLLCLIGGLAGDGRGARGGRGGGGGEGGGGGGGGGGVVEEEEGVSNCTTRLMSAKLGHHRLGYVSLNRILIFSLFLLLSFSPYLAPKFMSFKIKKLISKSTSSWFIWPSLRFSSKGNTFPLLSAALLDLCGHRLFL